MDEAVEELVDTVGEFLQRHDGRPLSDAERATVGRLLDRLEGIRATLARMLAVSGAEAMRLAMAGAGPATAGRADH